MRFSPLLSIVLVAVAVAACAPADGDIADSANDSTATAPAGTAMNSLTEQERADGWRLLFDGHSLDAWKGFKTDTVPSGWEAIDGVLTRTTGGGDLVSRESFTNFELALDWKVDSAGNSGVMFHVTEDGEWTYETGPEMQLLDDAAHADGKSPLTSAGAAFGLYPAPRGVVKPAGEWNSARLLVNGAHVEHWLNGERMVSYELRSPDWEAKVAASKFAQWPSFGRAASGSIALQDHGDRVEFRNIRIRVLP
jgi:hypothetical protein